MVSNKISIYILCVLVITLLSSTTLEAQYVSKNNNSGAWDDASTWVSGSFESDPVNGNYAAINGQVKWYPSGGDNTLNFNLGGNPPGPGDTALVVRDTLIIYGNLNFANKNNLYIEEGGLLIIYGDLSGDNKIELDPQGYLIIEGDLNFNNQNAGDITNGDNMYLGGNTTNCGDNECSNIKNDSTDLTSDSLDVFDLYKGEDPDINGTFSISPPSTDICSRSPQKVNLYFSDADNDNVDDFYWESSSDGSTFSYINDSNDEESIEITSSSTQYFRVKYSTDGGSTHLNSDTAVIYCNSLCAVSANISIASGNDSICYQTGVQIDLNSAPAGGTSPYTYSWSINPVNNSQGNPLTETENSDQVTYTDFTNPASAAETYTVSVEVTDNEGCSDTESTDIILLREPVTGNMYYVPENYDN